MEDTELKAILDSINAKLDKVSEDTSLIPQIFDIVTANGQGIETLSSRLDKLELVKC